MPPLPQLTVAVVGAGPAGMYVAEWLLAAPGADVRVDVLDRLPTPFGLLRYGVAPDHLKMKSLAAPMQATLDDDRVRFLGHVEVGRDVTVAELRSRYSAVVHAEGAPEDRRLGIPGEDLPGSLAAVEVVGWYSGHPDAEAPAGLAEARSAVVVGGGNVALDVTRLLVRDRDELATTDLPEPVLAALRASPVTDVHVLVRRGPAYAKFTTKELRDLGTLAGVDHVIDPAQLELDDEQQAVVDADKGAARNVALLAQWAQGAGEGGEPATGAARRVHWHFGTSPVEVVGEGRVEGVVVSRGGDQQRLDAGLVVRCVGYRGLPLEGVPFEADTGRLRATDGRVVDDGEGCPQFVAGWAGRGPTGVIGTNRSDARRVVEAVLAAELPEAGGWDDLEEVLRSRGVDVVTKEGWSRIDAAEVALGAEHGKAREKLPTWKELLDAAHPPDDGPHSPR